MRQFWNRFFIKGMLTTVKQNATVHLLFVPKYEKKEKDFETFEIGISLIENTDIEENDKLPITNENSTSTSILDQINAGLKQLNVDDYEEETVT